MKVIVVPVTLLIAIQVTANVIRLPSNQKLTDRITRIKRSPPLAPTRRAQRIDYDENYEEDLFDPNRKPWSPSRPPGKPFCLGCPVVMDALPSEDSSEEITSVQEPRFILTIFKKPLLTWRIRSNYSKIKGLTKSDLVHVIRTALDVWGLIIPVDFQQIIDDTQPVDIDFMFFNSDHDQSCGRKFNENELAHRKFDRARTFGNTAPAIIHFNGNTEWAIGDVPDPYFDLFTIVLHEIGHAFGLPHSNSTDSVMFQSYTGRFIELHAEDISKVRTRYGNRDRADTPAKTAPENILAYASGTTMSPEVSSVYQNPHGQLIYRMVRAGCTLGKFYCGWEMTQLGYHNALPHYLYQCNRDGEGAVVNDCLDGCLANGSLGAYCPCKPGRSYCGYALRQSNIGVSHDHGIYQCTGTQPLGLGMCNTRCIDHHSSGPKSIIIRLRRSSRPKCAHRSSAVCNSAYVYCGEEMIRNGFVSYPQVDASWDWSALYRCTDPIKKVQLCAGGCEIHRHENSSCHYRYVAKISNVRSP